MSAAGWKDGKWKMKDSSGLFLFMLSREYHFTPPNIFSFTYSKIYVEQYITYNNQVKFNENSVAEYFTLNKGREWNSRESQWEQMGINNLNIIKSWEFTEV